MSRFTFGGNGDGRDTGKKTFKASDMIKQKLIKKGNKAVGSSKYDGINYQEMMKARMEDFKSQMIREAGKRTTVQLPGVDPEQKRELSKNALEALETIARKKAKKEARAKKMKEAVLESNKKKKTKGPINFMAQELGFGAMQQAQKDDRSLYQGTTGRGKASWEDER